MPRRFCIQHLRGFRLLIVSLFRTIALLYDWLNTPRMTEAVCRTTSMLSARSEPLS
jgi:hypothetical protein